MNAQVDVKPDHKNIFAALAAAQMQMGKALKDSSNPAFKSKYADLASVMDACMAALNSNGIAVFQPTTDEDGNRFVNTILAHVSGETLSCRVPLIVQKNDMQGYGSAVTYARRYGLMSMAGIAPEEDDGTAAAKAAPMVEDRPAPRQSPQKEQPRDPAAIANGLIATFAKAQSVADLDGMVSEGRKAAEAWDWLEVEAKPEAARVKAAFDEKKAALQKTDLAAEIPY